MLKSYFNVKTNIVMTAINVFVNLISSLILFAMVSSFEIMPSQTAAMLFSAAVILAYWAAVVLCSGRAIKSCRYSLWRMMECSICVFSLVIMLLSHLQFYSMMSVSGNDSGAAGVFFFYVIYFFASVFYTGVLIAVFCFKISLINGAVKLMPESSHQ